MAPFAGFSAFVTESFSNAIQSARFGFEGVDRLIDDLEATIRQSGTSEVASQRIGEMVLERLAESDPMSYLRFKIVYAGLQDPDALYNELEALVRLRQDARDRQFAEQTTLPIEPAAAVTVRRRKR